jgi:hypothetical protein
MSRSVKKLLNAVIIPLALIMILNSFTITEAQQNNTPVLRPPPVDIKAIILLVSPLINVEYQGESIVVLKADEDALLLSNGTITPFWNAIDVVEHYGYHLDDVATSGMGSQGNPTRFYAIMSKP